MESESRITNLLGRFEKASQDGVVSIIGSHDFETYNERKGNHYRRSVVVAVKRRDVEIPLEEGVYVSKRTDDANVAFNTFDRIGEHEVSTLEVLLFSNQEHAVEALERFKDSSR